MKNCDFSIAVVDISLLLAKISSRGRKGHTSQGTSKLVISPSPFIYVHFASDSFRPPPSLSYS